MDAMNHDLPSLKSTAPYNERRNPRAPLFTLQELDPRDVIDGTANKNGYEAEDPVSSGTMRECCPYCVSTPLQLILRYKKVKRAHLCCDNCTRCFDALYPDGTSALIVGAAVLI